MTKIVIKIGGSLAIDEAKLEDFLRGFAQITALPHIKVALVHGGGKDINENIALLQEEVNFINGLRVTTPGIMKMVEMTLSGHVNKKLVRMLLAMQCPAVGISGVDGQIFSADKLKAEVDLGQVGDIHSVNPQLIQDLWQSGWTPVVSPISYGAEMPFNVNADTAASELAVALQADQFILVSDVPGVLDGEKNVIGELDAPKIATLIDQRIITRGMIPKVQASLDSIERGLKSIHIVGWHSPEHLRQQITGEENHGSIIR